MKFRPIEIAVGDRLNLQSREGLERAWLKALDRTNTDPDGAVTAARSFLESTCKQVLDALGVTYGPNLDLLQQFRLVAEQLKISAGSTGRIEKQFYNGPTASFRRSPNSGTKPATPTARAKRERARLRPKASLP